MTELPTGWVSAPLGSLGFWVGGGTPSKREETYWDGEIPWVSPKDMKVPRIQDTIDHITPEAVENSTTSLVPIGSVLAVTRSGILRHTFPVAVADREVAFNQDLKALLPASGIDPGFVAWALRAFEPSVLAACGKMGTTVQNIDTNKLLRFQMPVAPTAEQRQIVAAIEEHFSRLDAAEGALGSGLKRIKSLRGSSVDQLLIGPWPWTTTGEVAVVQGGIQKQPKRKPATNKAPFLRVANVLRGRLDLTTVHQIEVFDGDRERYEVRPGDLLVVEGNGSIEQIGRSALWRGEIEGCVHQNHLIRVRPGTTLLPAFLDIYWNASTTRRLLSQVASSTSGLYTLSTSKVKAVPIPVVPLDEQRRIVAEVDRGLSLIDALAVEVDAAFRRIRALRRSILERAFTGNLVPQDPADEPASVLLKRIAAERAAAPKPTRRRKKATA